jgi:UrcA family protein
MEQTSFNGRRDNAMNRAFLCFVLSASVLAGAAAAAQAEDSQMRVRLAGLDLYTADGAKAALGRIRFAAGAFCDEAAGRQGLERETLVNRCTAEMTRKAVGQLGAPLVTALLDRRSLSDRTVDVARR